MALLEWKPEYNKSIIEFAKQGMFLEEIAEEYEVDWWTMWNWTRNPKCVGFSKAYTRAKNIVLTKLKKDMLKCAQEKGYSSRGHEFLITQMTNQMQHSPVKIEGIAADKKEDRVKAVLKAAEDEQIRADQFNQLLTGLRTAMEIEDGYKALAVLEKIEEKK